VKRIQGNRRWAFGPGVVYLLGSVGPNDLIANSVAGATYGYSLLWTLVIAYVLHFCIAEAAARYILATGESIIAGYGRLGRPVVFVVAVAIFVRRHLNNLFGTVLLGSSAHLLLPLPTPWSPLIWSIVSFAFGFGLMFRGGYRGVERISRAFVPVLIGSLIVVAVLSHPSPSAVARGLFIPSYPDDEGFFSYLLVVLALAGTTVGSIGHLKYPAYVYEKGWHSIQDLRKQKFDLALSLSGQFLLAVLIQIAAAAAMHGQGGIHSIEDLSKVFSTHLGEIGRVVAGIGIWAVAFSSYLASNTGYGLLVADVYERYLSRATAGATPERRDERHRRAYRIVLTLFCVPPLYVLFTSWQPFFLGLFSNALFFMLTPLLMAGLLWMTSKRALMKDEVNGLVTKLAISAVIATSLFLTYEGVIEMIARPR
jgi:Mn2+/Fe2+ NRAMP family transporter